MANARALHELATSVLGGLNGLFNRENGNGAIGGWLCVLDIRGSQTGLIIKHEPIGKMTAERSSACCGYSREKAIRLSAHPDHATSRASRDPDVRKYGGAIRAQGFILSFSGLSEAEDEAVALYAAFKSRLLTLAEVRVMATPEILAIFDALTHAA